MHLIWNGEDLNLHYMVFNWVTGANTSSKFLYPKVIQTPIRAFWIGTKSEFAQGITFYQAYVGASMTTINTPSYNASRTKATAVILTTLKKTESCLVNTESSHKIGNMEEVKDIGL